MIQLSRSADLLVLAPEFGGAIVGWSRRGTYLLRRPSPDAVLLGRPGAMGCFPLVPFCNRIADRRFSWFGLHHELAANFGDHPHAIHGIGWQTPWRIEAVAADSATFSLHHDASGAAARRWPFAFAARLCYRLSEGGLTLQLDATNLHPSPAPMGIGAHPWFPRAAGASIAFQAEGVWFTRDALPVAQGPIPAEWNHDAGRPADGDPLDHCFTGWHGVARIPGMRIDADPVFGNLQVFTPAGADFFCIEPVSHVPDAINRAGLPAAQAMRVLAPGETLGGGITFRPDLDG